MPSKNKFGFEPVDADAVAPREKRSVGPMGAAVREAAESLQDATEAKVEQRRRNAEDAKAFRQAQDEGRVLITLPLSEIAVNDLPRDRLDLDAVASSDEMEELKSSIRVRGQKEPVEVYRDGAGAFQLKKGWRRYTALSQLLEETGEERFATVIARIEAGDGERMGRYIDMVEENVVREDLTFAEMAQVAITAADDDAIDEVDPNALVGRLYGALHKTKRSYIRCFVFLISALGEELRWPKEVGRDLGVALSRALKRPEEAEELRARLVECRSAEDQNRVLEQFLVALKSGEAREPEGQGGKEQKQKFEFFVGKLKVTARQGECRIVSDEDYTSVPLPRLEEAVKAFEETLRGKPRVSRL